MEEDEKKNLTETAHQTEDGCGGLGCRKLGLVRRDRVTTDMLRAGLKADIEGSSSVMVLHYSKKKQLQYLRAIKGRQQDIS